MLRASKRLMRADGMTAVAMRRVHTREERRGGLYDEGRTRNHGADARRHPHFALRLSPGCPRPLSGAVRGLAISIRNGRRAGLSAVLVARDRAGRMVCGPWLPLSQCGCAGL